MKKRLLMMTIFGLVLILSACNGDSEESGSTEENADETTEEPAENSEESMEEDSGSEAGISADELIDAAQDEWGGVDSYELNQINMIDSGDDSHSVRTITTHSDQNELKVEINHNERITTHYIVDNEHYIYSDDELEPQTEAVNIDNTSYGNLISQLDNYRSGEVSETEDGYSLNMQIENAEDASALLSDEVSGLLEEADDISGDITLTFDSEYQYDGGEMAAQLVSEGEDIELSSNISIENVDNIPVIEKPSGM